MVFRENEQRRIFFSSQKIIRPLERYRQECCCHLWDKEVRRR